MAMMERAFEQAGLSKNDMAFGASVIRFINDGGTFANAHRIVDLIAAKKLVREGHATPASNGHATRANSHQPHEDAGDQQACADEAKGDLSTASSANCERDSHINDADKATTMLHPARKPYKPNPPRGAEAIKSIQPTIKRGLMWMRKTNDRRLWATVTWGELYGMRRDGNLADLLLKRVNVHPSGNGQTIDEIVNSDIFDKAYYDAQEISDAA